MNNFEQKGGLSQVPKLNGALSAALTLPVKKPVAKPIQKPNPSKTFTMPVGGVNQNLLVTKALMNKMT